MHSLVWLIKTERGENFAWLKPAEVLRRRPKPAQIDVVNSRRDERSLEAADWVCPLARLPIAVDQSWPGSSNLSCGGDIALAVVK
jgi:hypothetical protein